MNQERYVIEIPKSGRIYMSDMRAWITKDVISKSAGKDMITLEGIYPAIIVKISRDTNIFVHDVNGRVLEIPAMSTENVINEILLKALEKDPLLEPCDKKELESPVVNNPKEEILESDDVTWNKMDEPVLIPECWPSRLRTTEVEDSIIDDVSDNVEDDIDNAESSADDSTENQQPVVNQNVMVKPIPRSNNGRHHGKK